MADRLRRRYLALGIPVVILTTLVGTSAFASLEQSGGVDDWARALVGVISIAAAVLSSLQTFLRYATRSEGHRIGAIRYETLRRDMAKTLALPRKSRGNAEHNLEGVALRMDRYAKESPNIGERLWNELAKEYHLSSVPPDPHLGDRAVVIPDSTEEAADRR
jgi:hypothetical protein